MLKLLAYNPRMGAGLFEVGARADSGRARLGSALILRDILVTVALAGGLWLTVQPPVDRGWQFLLAGLCAAAVVARHWSPLPATLVAAAMTATAWALGATADPCVLVGICLFTVAERRGTRYSRGG